MKPKFRKEAELDLRGAIQGAIWSQLNRNDIYPFQSCISCQWFNEKDEMCSFWKAKPPARTIVFGCEKYLDHSEVPF